MSEPVIGQCNVCGDTGKLTDEHIPPRSAFNDRRVVLTTMLNLGERGVRYPGKTYQDGHKRPVLCERCNNDTGRWYGNAYAYFVQYCAQYASLGLTNKLVGVDLCGVQPLRVFKQALTIICATTNPGVAEVTPEIRKLILSKESTGEPGHLRLFCYLLASVGGRATGVQGIGSLQGKAHVVAEFAWWPVGWVLAFSDQPIPSLTDVTHWCRYGYDEHTSLTALLPCRPVSTMFPLDYRTRAEVERDYRRNMEEGRIIR
jgi:hypothetical protein